MRIQLTIILLVLSIGCELAEVKFSYATDGPNSGLFVTEAAADLAFTWVGETVWKLTKQQDGSYLFETRKNEMFGTGRNGPRELDDAYDWPNLRLECRPLEDEPVVMVPVIEMRTEGANSPNIVGTGPVTLESGN